MLFPPGEVSLSREPLQILLIVVVLFDLENGLEELISLFGKFVNLSHHLLIARIKLPIGLEIVVTRVVLRKLKRSAAADWLVQSDLLLVAVLAWVLDRGHVLHLAGGLR